MLLIMTAKIPKMISPIMMAQNASFKVSPAARTPPEMIVANWNAQQNHTRMRPIALLRPS